MRPDPIDQIVAALAGAGLDPAEEDAGGAAAAAPPLSPAGSILESLKAGRGTGVGRGGRRRTPPGAGAAGGNGESVIDRMVADAQREKMQTPEVGPADTSDTLTTSLSPSQSTLGTPTPPPAGESFALETPDPESASPWSAFAPTDPNIMFDRFLASLTEREAAYRIRRGHYGPDDVLASESVLGGTDRRGQALNWSPLAGRIKGDILRGLPVTNPELAEEQDMLWRLAERADPKRLPAAESLRARAAEMGGWSEFREATRNAGAALEPTPGSGRVGPPASAMDPDAAARREATQRIAAATAEIDARSHDFWDDLPSDNARLVFLNQQRRKMGLGKLAELPPPQDIGALAKETASVRGVAAMTPWVRVVPEAADYWRALDASGRLERGKATAADLEVMADFQEKLARQSRGRTRTAGVANLIQEAIPFFLELGMSGGLPSLARAGGKKVAEGAVKRSLSAIIKDMAVTAGRETAGMAVTAAKRLPVFAPHIAKDAIGRMIPGFHAEELKRGQSADDLRIVVGEPGESIGTALKNAAIDNWIEIFSEQTGAVVGVIGKPLAAGAKALGFKPIRMGVTEFLRKAGWHGTIGEMTEERIGEAMREVATQLGAAELPQTFPTGEQLLREGLAFGAISGAATGADYGLDQARRASRKRQGETVKGLGTEGVEEIEGLGLSQEQLEAQKEGISRTGAEAQRGRGAEAAGPAPVPPGSLKTGEIPPPTEYNKIEEAAPVPAPVPVSPTQKTLNPEPQKALEEYARSRGYTDKTDPQLLAADLRYRRLKFFAERARREELGRGGREARAAAGETRERGLARPAGTPRPAEEARHVPVDELPPELGKSIQEEAKRLLAAPGKPARPRTQEALQRIVDDAGRDVGGDVAGQKKRILGRLTGEIDDRNVFEREDVGVPPRTPDPVVELLLEPDVDRRDIAVHSAIRSIDEGKPNELAQAARNRLSAQTDYEEPVEEEEVRDLLDRLRREPETVDIGGGGISRTGAEAQRERGEGEALRPDAVPAPVPPARAPRRSDSPDAPPGVGERGRRGWRKAWNVWESLGDSERREAAKRFARAYERGLAGERLPQSYLDQPDTTEYEAFLAGQRDREAAKPAPTLKSPGAAKKKGGWAVWTLDEAGRPTPHSTWPQLEPDWLKTNAGEVLEAIETSPQPNLITDDQGRIIARSPSWPGPTEIPRGGAPVAGEEEPRPAPVPAGEVEYGRPETKPGPQRQPGERTGAAGKAGAGEAAAGADRVDQPDRPKVPGAPAPVPAQGVRPDDGGPAGHGKGGAGDTTRLPGDLRPAGEKRDAGVGSAGSVRPDVDPAAQRAGAAGAGGVDRGAVEREGEGKSGLSEIVYHGTTVEFNEFKSQPAAVFAEDEGRFFFVNDRAVAQEYAEHTLTESMTGKKPAGAPRVVAARLRLLNPYEETLGGNSDPITYYDEQSWWMPKPGDEHGNDGIIISNEDGFSLYVAFYSEQIKIIEEGVEEAHAPAQRPQRELGKLGEIQDLIDRLRPQSVTSNLSPAADYVFTTDTIDYLEGKTQASDLDKGRNNLAAIELAAVLIREGRAATAAAPVPERETLAQYVGWGFAGNDAFQPRYDQKGWQSINKRLRELLTPEEYQAAENSTLNAHYTTPAVAQAVWAAVLDMGFRGGRVLEPAVGGNGVFLGMMPVTGRSQRAAVELDAVSARIAQLLYPNTDVRQQGYEHFRAPAGFFDLVISNVPFSDAVRPVHAELNRRGRLNLHNFFFVKALYETRPGGIVAFITSAGTLNSPGNISVRQQLAEQAEFLGAVRLPRTAFARIANTEVVGDVIFLQKKFHAEGAQAQRKRGTEWIDTVEVQFGDARLPVNRWFVEHPEMIVGTPSAGGTMYRGGEYTVEPPDGSLEAAMARAFARLPANVMGGTGRGLRRGAGAAGAAGAANLPQPARAGDLETIRDGEWGMLEGGLVRRQGDEFIPADEVDPALKRGTAAKRLHWLVRIRDLARRLLNLQIDDPDAKLAGLQLELTAAYEAFVRKYGPINRPSNRLLHGDDPTLLFAADYDSASKTETPGPIFSRRVYQQQRRPARAESAQDALVISLNESLRLDLDRIAELLEVTPKEAADRLAAEDLAYLDPASDEWRPADEYLSGPDMYDKLAQAESAARLDGRYGRNVEALRQVLPEPVTWEEMVDHLRPGQPYVPADVVESFADHLFGRGATLKRLVELGEWSIEKAAGMAARVEVSDVWGVPGMNGVELLQKTLNGAIPRIMVSQGPGEKPVFDAAATEAAKLKQAKLLKAFRDFVAGREELRARLADLYNRTFNAVTLRRFDGAHLTLPGSNPTVTLFPHQKDHIWRFLAGGTHMLDASPVGYGKSYVAAGAIMESKRLGLARKTLFVVPNHILSDTPIKIRELYPTARLLVAGQEISGDKKKRAGFLARIVHTDVDAIVVSYEMFQRMSFSEAGITAYFSARLRDLTLALEAEQEAAGGKKTRTVKRLSAMRQRLQGRMERRIAALKGEKRITFEELGIDQVMFDEPHEKIKNLGYGHSQMGGRVKGLGDVSGSDAAFHAHMVTEYLTRLNNGRGVLFMTGTPLKNSLAEAYTMMRYLAARTLDRLGINSLDGWAQMFAAPESTFEVDVSMQYRSTTRLLDFTNLDQLAVLFSSFTAVPPESARQDIEKQTGRKIPIVAMNSEGERSWETITVDPPPEFHEFIRSLQERMEKIRSGKVQPDEDNALAVFTAGRKASLDMRLVNPSAGDWPGSKLHRVVELVRRKWEQFQADKGTILVFMELGTPKGRVQEEGEEVLYRQMQREMIESGIPAGQVAVIHDANNEQKKFKLQEAMNAGEIRVLIGSSRKMGTGLNLQQRGRLLIQVDPPYTPAEVEQATGRFLRQGNVNAEVELVRFVTSGSLDAFMYQLLQSKLTFLLSFARGLLRGVKGWRDVDPEKAASYGLAKALAANNPLMVEQQKVGRDLARLELLRSQHLAEQRSAAVKLAGIPAHQSRLGASLEIAERANRVVHAADPDVFRLTVGDRTFDKHKEAGEALLRQRGRDRPAEERRVGELFGLEVWISGVQIVGKQGVRTATLRVSRGGAEGAEEAASARISDDPVGVVRSLQHLAAGTGAGLDERVRALKGGLAKLAREEPLLQTLARTPFSEQGALDAALKRIEEIDVALGLREAAEEVSPAEGEEGEQGPDEDEEGGGGAGATLAPQRPQYLSVEQRAWMRSHRDQPLFGLGGMAATVPEATNWRKRMWDRTAEKMQHAEPGVFTSLAGWFGRGLLGTQEWGTTPEYTEAELQRRGRIGRAQRDVDRLLRKWNRWHRGLEQALQRDVQHHLFEQVILGERPATDLPPGGAELIENYRTIIGEIQAEMIDRKDLHPFFQYRLKNLMEIVQRNFERGTYLRRLVKQQPVAKALIPYGPVGPRLITGPLKERRSTGLWTVQTVEKPGSVKPVFYQFESEAEAVSFFEAERAKWEGELGRSVRSRVALREPFTEESLERARASGKVQTDVRVLMARSVVDSVVNVETAKFYQVIKETIAEAEDPRGGGAEPGWEKLSVKDPSLGPLQGMWVPKYVARHLFEFDHVSRETVDLMWDSFLSIYKTMKIAPSPVTAFNALWGNALIGLTVDLISPMSNPGLFVRAARELAADSPLVRRLYDEGVMAGFYHTGAREPYQKLLGELRSEKARSIMAWIGERAFGTVGKLGDAQDFLDRLWKTASYLRATDRGWTHEEAAAHVRMAYPNYLRTGRLARWSRRNPFGQTFATFLDAMLKTTLWLARNHPIRLAAVLAAPWLVSLFSQVLLGLDDDELALLGYAKGSWWDSWFKMVLPITDGSGRPYILDLRYASPWYSILETHAGPGGIGIPFMLQQPGVKQIIDIGANKDSYSGMPITEADDGVIAAIAKRVWHVAKGVAPLPSLATYLPGKIIRAAGGESGESVAGALASGIAGVRVSPARPSRPAVYRAGKQMAKERDFRGAVDLAMQFNKWRTPKQAVIDPENLIRAALREKAGEE